MKQNKDVNFCCVALFSIELSVKRIVTALRNFLCSNRLVFARTKVLERLLIKFGRQLTSPEVTCIVSIRIANSVSFRKMPISLSFSRIFTM